MDDADKEYLATDLSGTYPNNIYAAWTDISSQYYDVRRTRSTNSGSTFEQSQIIYSNPINYGQGTFITTASNGYVYLIFARLGKGSNTENAIMFAKSTNGGQSYSTPQVAFTIAGIGPPNASQERFGFTRANSFPSMDVYGEIIFKVYADESNGSSDVYLRYSATGGDTWSAAKMVNASSNNQQWFPSVSVDKSNGKVYVSYFSMDGIDYTTSHYVAVTTDYGTTFTRTKISDINFIPEELGVGYADGYMGDYYEIKASNGWVFPCWSHNNNSSGKFQAYISPIGGEAVELDQKLSNNITTVDKIDLYKGSVFKELEIPKVYHLRPQRNYVLRGEQSIISYEKYNKWNIDNDVVNHRTFSFQTGQAPQSLISRFNPTYPGITIKNFLESSSTDGGQIEFRDPWLIDYPDPAFSNQLRNRGMNDAIFYQRPSPFNPIYGCQYKGVFLNQPYTGNNPVYYSVKSSTQDITLTNTGNPAGRTHRFYFQNWSYDANKISLQSPTSSQTGVVFKTSDAELNANLKGTQLSNSPNAYNTNSQRKYVKTDDGYLHCVYESMGKVWYEVSRDNGASWVIQNNVNPISSSGKQPAIDYHYYYDPVSGGTY